MLWSRNVKSSVVLIALALSCFFVIQGCEEPKHCPVFRIPVELTGGDSVYLGQPMDSVRSMFDVNGDTYSDDFQYVVNCKQGSFLYQIYMNKTGGRTSNILAHSGFDMRLGMLSFHRVIALVEAQLGISKVHETLEQQGACLELVTWKLPELLVTVSFMYSRKGRCAPNTSLGSVQISAKCLGVR